MAGHCGQRQLYLVIYRINTIPNWLKLFALYNNIVKLQVWAWKPTVYDKCHSLVAIMSNSITHYIVFQRNTTSQTLWRRIAGARSCSSIWFINFELYSLWRQHIYPRVFFDNQLPAISSLWVPGRPLLKLEKAHLLSWGLLLRAFCVPTAVLSRLLTLWKSTLSFSLALNAFQISDHDHESRSGENSGIGMTSLIHRT